MAASAPLRDPLLPLFYPRLRMWTHAGTEWLSGDRDTATERRGGRRGSRTLAPPPPPNTGAGEAASERGQPAARTEDPLPPSPWTELSHRKTRPGSRVTDWTGENKHGLRGPGRQRARAHMHSLTRPALVPRARRHQVTTRMDTSHYEYCFQREAIHGIKTSTRGPPPVRTTAVAARAGGSRLRVGDPLTVHGAAQELLHAARHIHRVFQVEVPIGVKDGVRAGKGKKRMGEGRAVGDHWGSRPPQASGRWPRT